MMKMSQIETIREMWMDGKSKTEIHKLLGVSRPTIDKYIGREDFLESVSEHVTASGSPS